jgi:hypothetical protein
MKKWLWNFLDGRQFIAYAETKEAAEELFGAFAAKELPGTYVSGVCEIAEGSTATVVVDRRPTS